MDTNAVLDLVGINLRNLVFFMQAGFTLVETGFTDQRTQEYNNENLMDFCIGSVAFWAIGYLNVWNFNRLCHRNLKLVFDSAADMHSLFFSNWLQLLQQLFLVLLLREQNSRPI
jgi:Amt family ammonium transporter